MYEVYQPGPPARGRRKVESCYILIIYYYSAAKAEGGQRDDSKVHTPGNGENLERTERMADHAGCGNRCLRSQRGAGPDSQRGC